MFLGLEALQLQYVQFQPALLAAETLQHRYFLAAASQVEDEFLRAPISMFSAITSCGISMYSHGANRL